MHEQSIYLFTNFVLDHRYLGYTVLFLAMIIEGEVLLIVAGMLARLKSFDLGDVLWISFAGVIIGDVLWYALGILTSSSKRFSLLVQHAEKSVHAILPRFQQRPFQSIMLSKFIYGANHATLIMSGVMRVKFSTFIKAETIASFVWVAIYAVAGYMFGHAALAVTHKAIRFMLVAALFVVGFIFIQRWVGNYYERKENEEITDNNS